VTLIGLLEKMHEDAERVRLAPKKVHGNMVRHHGLGRPTNTGPTMEDHHISIASSGPRLAEETSLW